MFHLNYTSNPHRVILIYLEHKSKLTQALSERICRDLRDVHRYAQLSEKIIDSPYVPFTIMVTERTLQDGVVMLRHFNPRISEQVHISDLKDKILYH